jgi:hypothetical protein
MTVSTANAALSLPLNASHRGLSGMQDMPAACSSASSIATPNMLRQPPIVHRDTTHACDKLAQAAVKRDDVVCYT